MKFISIGLNHKTAPIEIRERLFLTLLQQDLLLSELKNVPSVFDACILSTCNRVEIYAHVLDDQQSFDLILALVFRIKNIPLSSRLSEYFYRFCGREAIRHLLEVSTGLDSLVLGEEQILGQVKLAFDRSRELGMLNREFNILANIAVRTGKKARHETKINFGGSSISWAAVAKAEEVLGDLSERSALVIGAGTMSELAVGHIQNKRFKKFYLMNRTIKHAQNLSEKYGGEVVAFCDIKEVLTKIDVCICSAGAPHYLLEKDVVKKIMPARAGKQLILIDISMPRNIDPSIETINNVLLYQIDDLKESVHLNMKVRENAISEVRAIIDKKISEYEKKLKRLPSEGEFPSLHLDGRSGCA